MIGIYQNANLKLLPIVVVIKWIIAFIQGLKLLEAAYYNEIDPFAAQWLRNLIAKGLIADGDVDERSIKDVRAADLKGYTQCHFFAGIGGWSRALLLAGWSDARHVWTGSCPCQPFSVAGKQKAQADDRHLWPAWFALIRECRPAIIFGEQVTGAIAKGWLDDVYQGLEGEGYAVAAAVLPACSVGAPHKRDRVWFVAHTDESGPQGRNGPIMPECAGERIARSSNPPLADTEHGGLSFGRGNAAIGEELSGLRRISDDVETCGTLQAKKNTG